MIALSVAKLKFFFAGKRNFPWYKAKEKKRSCGKFGSISMVRNVFVMGLRLSDHQALHNITSSSSFFHFATIFSLFSLVSRTSKLLELKEFNKTIFHSRLLDMRLVIANSALCTFAGYLPSHIQRALMEKLLFIII